MTIQDFSREIAQGLTKTLPDDVDFVLVFVPKGGTPVSHSSMEGKRMLAVLSQVVKMLRRTTNLPSIRRIRNN